MVLLHSCRQLRPGQPSATLGNIIKNPSPYLEEESFIYGLYQHFFVTESSEHPDTQQAGHYGVSTFRIASMRAGVLVVDDPVQDAFNHCAFIIFPAFTVNPEVPVILLFSH